MIAMLLSISALFVFTLSLKKVKAWIRWPLWAVVSLAIIIGSQWSQIINLILPYETRPESIKFPVETASDEQFEIYANELPAKLGSEHLARGYIPQGEISALIGAGNLPSLP